jgi:hypothetical protein
MAGLSMGGAQTFATTLTNLEYPYGSRRACSELCCSARRQNRDKPVGLLRS